MKKIYFLACLFVLSVSCQKDEIAPPISDIELQNQERVILHFDNLPENIQQYFDEDFSIRIPGKKQNSPFGKINKNIKAKKVRLKNGITTYTFALLTNSDDIAKSQEGYYFDNLVIKETEYEDELYVIRYEPTQEWLNTGHDFGNFQGIITLFSLDGEKLNSIDTINVGSSGETNKEVCPAYLVSVTYSCSGMESSSTQSCYWIYTYEVSCPAGGTTGTSTGGGDTGDGIPDPASIPTEPTEDWDYGAGGGTDTSNTAEPMVVKESTTTAFQNNLKINCTYLQLKETQSIATILIDFFGEDALFDVTFDVVQNLTCNDNPNASGCTTPLPGDAYRIDIDLDYINNPNTPTIFLAQTLIHEAIHANLYAAVKKLNYGITPSDKTFKGLYDQYRQLKGWQHQMMADHYTDIMQQALREIHPLLNDGQFLNNYGQLDPSYWDWDKFYEYLSYRGLHLTDKGIEYYNNNATDISKYETGAEADSTPEPNCTY